jgi:hypothetical protein
MSASTWINLIFATILGIATKVAPTPGHPEVGIGVHGLDQRSVAHLVDLGIRRVRYTLYWSHWHDPEYRRNWEGGIARALQSGLEPLIVVHQAPSGGWKERKAIYREFAKFMMERAAQFPDVRAWQLWNEMDVAFTDVFGAGRPDISMRERGQLYAEMLRLAYPAIKRANPHASVVVGGIGSDIENGFLEGIYDGGAQYDVLAIHTYGFPLEPAFSRRGLAVRRLMQLHNDKRPLWNTEFGLERAVVPGHLGLTATQTDSIQLGAWRGVLEANARDGIYDRVYGYVLAEGSDLGFGLVRLDGSPRPTYQWLKNWTQQR